MEFLLRGFYGSRIRRQECDEELEFQGRRRPQRPRGYVKKTVETRLGPIQMKRAYYHGKCSHSAAPLDHPLGVEGKHSVLRSKRCSDGGFSRERPGAIDGVPVGGLHGTTRT